MQIQTEGGSRSRQTSGTGSITSVSSMSSPRSPTADGHPGTKTAGDIKAGLVNSSHEGDLGESHDSLPSPNGNLR